jgi:hypothetical protein
MISAPPPYLGILASYNPADPSEPTHLTLQLLLVLLIPHSPGSTFPSHLPRQLPVDPLHFGNDEFPRAPNPGSLPERRRESRAGPEEEGEEDDGAPASEGGGEEEGGEGVDGVERYQREGGEEMHR